MAAIAPTVTAVGSAGHGQSVAWGPFGASDTATPHEPMASTSGLGAFQVAGTFTGTVQLLVSNDGLAFYPLVYNRIAIQLTAPGILEVSTAARYLKPTALPGASVILSLRG